MKLVEILARELTEWPFADHLPLTQAYDGHIFVSSADRGEGEGTLRTGITLTIADDISGDEPVTFAQWEAERARIAAEEAPTWHIGTETEDWRNECQKQYEQELWDKVAVAAMQSLTSSYWESQDAFEDAKALVKCQCESACEYADAFMAERAKRMKQ